MRSRQLRQISACQFSSRSWSLEEDLLGYRNFGFESIGLWRQKIEDYGVDEAIDLIHESSLSVSSLHFAGGGSVECQLSIDSSRLVERSLEKPYWQGFSNRLGPNFAVCGIV